MVIDRGIESEGQQDLQAWAMPKCIGERNFKKKGKMALRMQIHTGPIMKDKRMKIRLNPLEEEEA